MRPANVVLLELCFRLSHNATEKKRSGRKMASLRSFLHSESLRGSVCCTRMQRNYFKVCSFYLFHVKFHIFEARLNPAGISFVVGPNGASSTTWTRLTRSAESATTKADIFKLNNDYTHNNNIMFLCIAVT